jgi:hypothetical protein
MSRQTPIQRFQCLNNPLSDETSLHLTAHSYPGLAAEPDLHVLYCWQASLRSESPNHYP